MTRVNIHRPPWIIAIASFATFPRTSTSLRFVARFTRLEQLSRRPMSSFTRASTPALIDVDCNLCHADLKSLRNSNENDVTGIGDILTEDAVAESNIVAMLSPSSTLEEARRSILFLNDKEKRKQWNLEILTTVGVHPYHVKEKELGSPDLHYAEFQELLHSSPHFIAAIGECGLDASDGFPPLEDQIPWFEAQVQWAREFRLPLFVHERLAFHETMRILEDITMMTSSTNSEQKQHQVPVIIHCFTGTREECAQYVARGYSFSVSGFLAKKDGMEVRQCLIDGVIPLDKLMIETDAPYMGFSGCRDQWMEKHWDHVASLNSKQRKRLQNTIYPNLPSALPLVLDQVVECINAGRKIRGEVEFTREYLAQVTTKNAIEFFGFKCLNLE